MAVAAGGGDPRTMIAAYLETANEIEKMDALQFFSRFGEASRVLKHLGGNADATAMSAIPLQISSSLSWEGIDADGKPLRFAHHTVATDADHTGAMNEALVTLAREPSGGPSWYYLLRVPAFLLIAAAIVHKNTAGDDED